MIDPFVGLALAAGATRKIGLGTGICLVPERSPLILAKVIATLDYYSGGRFIFGIGAGWLRDESEIMGVNFKRRWDITRDYVRAMKELWTKPQPSFDGEFVKFPAVKANPKPARKPHPTVHIGGGGVGPSMDRALADTVEIGDGWAPLGVPPERLIQELAKLKKLCAEAGRDYRQLEITMYAPVMQAGDPKRTIAAYEEAGVHRLILFPEKLGPNDYRRALETMAKAWVA
jgi:probable F420-dependent oxidoreductase